MATRTTLCIIPGLESAILAALLVLSACSPATVVGGAGGASGSGAGDPHQESVGTPRLSPSPGIYSTPESISLTDATAGATIYYTTDGSSPTTLSSVYTSPIPMAGNSVALPIKAIAAKAGLKTSVAASGTYMLRQLAASAETSSSGSDDSVKFYAAAAGTGGEVIAVGSAALSGPGGVSFGNGVGIAGPAGGLTVEAIIVAYSPSGSAIWAQAVASTGASSFSSVAVDSSGNICVAGRIHGPGVAFTFGNAVSVTGVAAMGDAVLAKYDSAGKAQWAVTTQAGSDQSSFFSVAVDTVGNIYAAGYLGYSGSVGFGNEVTVKGPSSDNYNAVLVQYNSAGVAQWARNPVSVPNGTIYYAVAAGSSGDLYAAGSVIAPGTYTFGTGVSVTSTVNTAGVLVKYDASGTAQWARIVGNAIPRSIVADSSGDVYLATSGVAALSKYDSSGREIWNAMVAGTGGSAFFSVALDGSGNVYAAGDISGPASFEFGDGVYAISRYEGDDVVVVQYDAATGAAQWAQTTTSSSNPSVFYGVCAQNELNVYAVGMISGMSAYDFGDEVSVAGSSDGSGSLLVKYF